jgi:hypothetical protein
MTNQVKVKDMIIGKCYKQSNKIYGKLEECTIISYGGCEHNDDQYLLIFENGQIYTKYGYICFEELYICPFSQKNKGKE